MSSSRVCFSGGVKQIDREKAELELLMLEEGEESEKRPGYSLKNLIRSHEGIFIWNIVGVKFFGDFYFCFWIFYANLTEKWEMLLCSSVCYCLLNKMVNARSAENGNTKTNQKMKMILKWIPMMWDSVNFSMILTLASILQTHCKEYFLRYLLLQLHWIFKLKTKGLMSKCVVGLACFFFFY